MSFAQTTFLTGFPGFIAERLVARLARPDVQFFLLVQPEFVEKAMGSVERIAEDTATPLESFALIEGLEDVPDCPYVHANPGVTDLDQYSNGCVVRSSYRNPSALGSEFHSVGEQINHHLYQSISVPNDLRQPLL